MSIQEALLNAGLTTQQKINQFEGEKALTATLAGLSQKISAGAAKPRDFAVYARLKRRAPQHLRYQY